MTDPLKPLRRLADVTDVATASTDELLRRAHQLRDALAQEMRVALGAARRAIAVELHEQRGMSFDQLGEAFGVGKSRADQIVKGHNLNSSQRRARAAEGEDGA
jgi:plasmid maintenance system antidote protein VapI